MAKTWQQPKCPSTEEWIKKWYIYIMEYYSPMKKNKIRPFAATWMDLESVILNEVSQRRRNVLWLSLYVKSKKKWYKWTYLQNRNRLSDLENKLVVSRGKDGGGRGIIREFGMDVYTLLCLKQITSKRLTLWHRELCSVLCGSLDGRGVWARMDTCICMAESLPCPPETISQHC